MCPFGNEVVAKGLHCRTGRLKTKSVSKNSLSSGCIGTAT